MLSTEQTRMLLVEFGPFIDDYLISRAIANKALLKNFMLSALEALAYKRNDLKLDIYLGVAFYRAELDLLHLFYMHEIPKDKRDERMKVVIKWCQSQFKLFLFFPKRTRKTYEHILNQKAPLPWISEVDGKAS